MEGVPVLDRLQSMIWGGPEACAIIWEGDPEEWLNVEKSRTHVQTCVLDFPPLNIYFKSSACLAHAKHTLDSLTECRLPPIILQPRVILDRRCAGKNLSPTLGSYDLSTKKVECL